MKHKVVNSQNVSQNCLVCGIDNDFGLKTSFYETENGELVAVFRPLQEHQSYPNVMHGGISATILDETIGRAIMMTTDNNTFGVTLELHVRYRKPVPLECELRVVSRITSDRGRIFEGTGELYLPDGTVAVEAEGKYMKRNLAQITDKDFTSNEWFEPKESIPDEIVV
jgi:uncharacterized protein (TIGR00369 family)